ncbi:dihydrofolate reductase [Pullulanibacillus pueri]|uniref:Dihydrofolate reductase n=1 Tax=Pullulanibacillus pueri TaxID=1437324 RepID=A0A8J2ZV56_9BACL|nr:dihydrofolate reductase [Pullulanibacillus pueri]MBM7682329.1 dihydrofolate reductase [Pullulanibacillus pueri]GGH80774.1 dihydrofolate reductase [Pullulanibacillus pueri]
MMAFLLAMDENHLIGKGNNLPWHLPADLKYFKHLTMGHAIVMGRKTYESIGKPLPGRTNIILTKDSGYQAEGCLVFHSPEDILTYLKKEKEWFVIGGAGAFKAFKSQVERLYVTYIHHQFEGDTFFNFNFDDWTLASKKEGSVDEKNKYAHDFLVYERNSK